MCGCSLRTFAQNYLFLSGVSCSVSSLNESTKLMAAAPHLNAESSVYRYVNWHMAINCTYFHEIVNQYTKTVHDFVHMEL